MPLVRIDVRQGRSPALLARIGAGVHRAMVETIGVPADDCFQVIREHPADGLIYNAEYLGINRSAEIVFIQITLNMGRTVEQKRALYARTAALLAAEASVRPEDVLISLVEVVKENWSFGAGEAQYAPTTPQS